MCHRTQHSPVLSNLHRLSRCTPFGRTPPPGIPISTYLRAQASSNPELSDALGPASAPRQSHQCIWPQTTTYDGTAISPYSSAANTLGHEGSPSSMRLVYPYPERNVVHPTDYTGYMPPAANKMSYKTVVPPGFHQLPQTTCIDKCVQPSSWSRIGSQHPPIKFNRKGGGEPFRVDELTDLSDKPKVEGRHDQVFKNIGERYIKVVMTWPGYSQFPVERRICTENGTLTRDRLLIILATHIEEFMHHVHRKEIPVERGYEKYELIWRPRGLTNVWRDCFITSLVHRSGSTWQVELYVRN
ncbi:hypothetical protein DFH29DRAFT_90613 [Suillus ampliporus]|nr:hypothetical protein DFH29DRAFT_90613 [Suillus ampliporus]